MILKIILNALFLGCLVGILNGENIQLDSHKLDQMDQQLDKYILAEYSNKSNLGSEHSNSLSRVIRGAKRCATQELFKFSMFDCLITNYKVACTQKCNWGYKFRNGKKSRKIVCMQKNGRWKINGKKIPKKNLDCKPYVDCEPKLRGLGAKRCYHAHNKPTVCLIACGGRKRKYKCNLRGKWKPKLPHCAKPGKHFSRHHDRDSEESSEDDEDGRHKRPGHGGHKRPGHGGHKRRGRGGHKRPGHGGHKRRGHGGHKRRGHAKPDSSFGGMHKHEDDGSQKQATSDSSFDEMNKHEDHGSQKQATSDSSFDGMNKHEDHGSQNQGNI